MKSSIQSALSTLFMILGYMTFFAVVTTILEETGISLYFESIISSITGATQGLSNRHFCWNI